MAVCFLLHFPWPRGRWALPTTASCGARTFLRAELLPRSAAVRPTANYLDLRTWRGALGSRLGPSIAQRLPRWKPADEIAAASGGGVVFNEPA